MTANGRRMPMLETPAAYAPPSSSDILGMVKQHYDDVEPLRLRMERDYGRYRLTSHVNRDNVTGEPLKNFAVYTSNRHRVFADKVISWQALAELLVRVPHMDPGQHTEETDNLKERFAIGCLRAADERLNRLVQPSLRNMLATFCTIRGGYIGGRALLVNRPDGTAYADITAWDPMHTHWGLGMDGLDWAAYRIKKTRQQIRSEYGVDMVDGRRWFSFPFFRPAGSTDAEKEGVWVADWYDGMVNTVVTDSEVLKEPTLHGSPRVPVYLSLSGPAPVLQSETASNLIADVGESVYAPVREVGDKINSILSIAMEIVERARRQTIITESQDGTKALPESIYQDGTAIGVRIGEKIYTLELQKMAQETMAYITLIDGEWQRGTIPHSSYGDTPFQLSGFAINLLRQATETVLAGRIATHEQIYLQIANLLYDQFMTDGFNGMELSGVDAARNYFNMEIRPEMLEGSCDYTVEMASQLPQDDQGKWGMAQIAKATGLYSDIDIHDIILSTQDSKQAMDRLRDQKAQEGLPEAQLYTLGMAAAERGDMIVARMYIQAFDVLMAQKYGLMPPAGGTQVTPKGGGGQQPAKPKGPLPQVQPHAMTGAPPEPETSNNGPAMVPPGTPRPGAQRQPQ